jgi:hypothetical protein
MVVFVTGRILNIIRTTVTRTHRSLNRNCLEQVRGHNDRAQRADAAGAPDVVPVILD